MRFGLNLGNGGPSADPRTMADLAELAEQSGWDGVFLEDYIVYQNKTGTPTYDPWVCLAAMAMRTQRIRLGTTVTPLPRRRVAKLAAETIALDHLSGGRLTLGVGLGDAWDVALANLGEQTTPMFEPRCSTKDWTYWSGCGAANHSRTTGGSTRRKMSCSCHHRCRLHVFRSGSVDNIQSQVPSDGQLGGMVHVCSSRRATRLQVSPSVTGRRKMCARSWRWLPNCVRPAPDISTWRWVAEHGTVIGKLSVL